MADSTSDTPVDTSANDPLHDEIERWAESSTKSQSKNRPARVRDKIEAVTGFFYLVNRPPQNVRPPDVRIWRDALEACGHKATAIRERVSLLSSFFGWLINRPTSLLSITKNPVKITRSPLLKEASPANATERTEALVERARSMMTEEYINFRDFSMDDLDEAHKLLQYHTELLPLITDEDLRVANQEMMSSLEGFRTVLKKVRIMYLVCAMRAVPEIDIKSGEHVSWGIVIEQLRRARPGWRIPLAGDYTAESLDRLDALLIESLNEQLNPISRTRLAAAPLAHHGFIRFPGERIFKATLEALMPGAMHRDSALTAALKDLSEESRRVGGRLAVAYVFKSKKGDLEGAIGFPREADLALRRVLQERPALAVKVLFALWSRLYAETGDPTYGEFTVTSVSQFCDDLGYKRKKGAHEPANRRNAIRVLKALMGLEVEAIYRTERQALRLCGPVFNSVQLSPEVRGYSDIFVASRSTGDGTLNLAGAFAYGPGPVYASMWRARNRAVALVGEGLLKLSSDNKDRWTVLVGGYLASLARMNGYRQQTIRTETLVERTGLYGEKERHRKFGRMRDKLETALDRLQEIGLIRGWELKQPQNLDDEEKDGHVVEDMTGESPEWTREWPRWRINISWPEALKRHASELEQRRARHKRAARRKVASNLQRK